MSIHSRAATREYRERYDEAMHGRPGGEPQAMVYEEAAVPEARRCQRIVVDGVPYCRSCGRLLHDEASMATVECARAVCRGL